MCKNTKGPLLVLHRLQEGLRQGQVQWDVHILDDLGLDDKDFRDIQNVYFNQTAKGRTLDAETDEIRIENGVRQVVCIHFICSTRTANA